MSEGATELFSSFWGRVLVSGHRKVCAIHVGLFVVQILKHLLAQDLGIQPK